MNPTTVACRRTRCRCASRAAILLVSLSCYALLAVAQEADPAPADPAKAQALLERWASAVGGSGAVRAIRSLHTRATVGAAGMQGTLETWQASDGRRRERLTLGGILDDLIVFDGRTAWARDRLGRVRELAGPERALVLTNAYLDSFSHLAAGRMRGVARCLGLDEAGRSRRLLLEPEGGQPVEVLFDLGSELPARSITVEEGVRITTAYEDWRLVDGLRFPFRLRRTGGASEIAITIEEVQVNPPPADGLFVKPEEKSGGIRFAEGRAARDIPVEIAGNKPYVQARVNGAGPLWFMLDTGAAGLVIDAARAAAIGLRTEGSLSLGGAGAERVSASVASGVTIGLPGLDLPDQSAVVIPLDERLGAIEGRPIEGLLGYDFFSRFIVEIDYAALRLHVHDPNSWTYGGSGEILPAAIEQGYLYVTAKIVPDEGAPIEGKFMVDTGMRGAISTNAPFTRSHGLIAATHGTFEATVGIGIGGEVRHKVGRLREVRLGGLVLPRPVITLSEETQGAGADPSYAGFIEGQILRKFRAIFDYPGQRLILEKGPSLADPFEFDMSGIFPVMSGPESNEISVLRILEGSPAAEAGLREGDVIETIDGRAAPGITLDEMREMFRIEGKTYRLRIRRSGETFEIALETRRLV